MKQFNLIDELGNQIWYLDTEDRSADVLNDRIDPQDLSYHRLDGPAYISADGYKQWCLNGKFHREDGPALIYLDGSQAWYVNAQRYCNNKSFQEAAKLTDEEMMIVILKYGNVS